MSSVIYSVVTSPSEEPFISVLAILPPVVPIPHTSLEPVSWRTQLFLITGQSSIPLVSLLCSSDPTLSSVLHLVMLTWQAGMPDEHI